MSYGNCKHETYFELSLSIFKGNPIESYKYCILIAGGNTKISKTHSLLNKMLSLCLLRLKLTSPFSTADAF